MRLMSLNTHSLIETNYEEKLQSFVSYTAQTQPDIIALQEVNQALDQPLVDTSRLQDFAGEHTGVREGNHALRVYEKLKEAGVTYSWYWDKVHLGYDIYEEGLALFSRYPIVQVKSFYISTSHDIKDWKARKAIGICIKKDEQFVWYYSLHMGWWKDEKEDFIPMWERFEEELQEDKQNTIWLLGDFNAPAHLQAESYAYVTSHHWQDTYTTAKQKDSGITVGEAIDGWRDEDTKEGIRIDYIFCNKATSVQSHQVIFNGLKQPIVSDHFGILVEE